MSKIVVRAENLSKRYQLGGYEPARTLGETVSRAVSGLLHSGRHNERAEPASTFWALKDVSFEVKQGERIGIIGSNGAGKSTLLKILSRVVQPTRGSATLVGRVGSLLEVGTGFHPELTGRENVYLNGAILGLPRADIDRHFDSIVDFAGVEQFIDTPVKRYSSGMSVRLAFAVAAHLEPEILIVDEVLAVGDASFQRKSIGRMENAAEEGRTILFVSHSMPSVRKLCPKSLYLEKGQAKAFGPTEQIIEQYLGNALYTDAAEREFPDKPHLDGVIRRIAVTDSAGRPIREFGLDQQAYIEIEYELKRDVRDCIVICAIGRDGAYIYQTYDTDLDPELLIYRKAGWYKGRLPLPKRLLTGGTYTIYPSLAIGLHGEYGHDGQPDAVSFAINEDDQSGNMQIKSWSQHRGMMIVAEIGWDTERLESPAAK
ncbi:MAG: ABC transporter ATP-binding protein [Ferrovibrio sp.]|uniref:ABC transporter ATP-binding protein n=1 Tax=Ferrovibrio sp. TaxID=1917215 RepID=UPI00391CBE37